jgi:RNA polymerase sigma factor (sigma-70 family)
MIFEPKMDDATLLNAYLNTGSAEAFSAIVERYLDSVYSDANRLVGDPILAEDVTQAVFIILARRARRLKNKASLSEWIHDITRDASANARRGRHRRARRTDRAQSPHGIQSITEAVCGSVANPASAPAAALIAKSTLAGMSSKALNVATFVIAVLLIAGSCTLVMQPRRPDTYSPTIIPTSRPAAN